MSLNSVAGESKVTSFNLFWFCFLFFDSSS